MLRKLLEFNGLRKWLFDELSLARTLARSPWRLDRQLGGCQYGVGAEMQKKCAFRKLPRAWVYDVSAAWGRPVPQAQKVAFFCRLD
jgi:hypothetical protein